MFAPRRIATLLSLTGLLLGLGNGIASAQVKAVISGSDVFYASHAQTPQSSYADLYFDAYQSEGDIVYWEWGGWFYNEYGPEVTGSISGGDDCPYTQESYVTLYVEDSQGNWDIAEKYFMAMFPNQAPTANAGPDQWYFAPQGLNVTLHGSGSDADGDDIRPAEWWVLGGDNHGSDQWDPTIFLFPGVSRIWLWVFDGYSTDHCGDTIGMDEVVITVYGSWIDSLSKTSCYAGGYPPTLTVTGKAFRKGAVITWNGQGLPTTWLSPTQLRTKLTSEQIALAGVYGVGVSNPRLDNWESGGFSNTVDFTVMNRLPYIGALDPSFVVHGSPGFTLNVIGDRFAPGAVVFWKGEPRPTVYVSPKQLQAEIFDADVALPGKAIVFVNNPGPGGGNSSTRVFVAR